MDFDRFEAISFDCYGTLIDWEAGILTAVKPVLARRGIDLPDVEILSQYAEIESGLERGPFRSYVDILRLVMIEWGRRFGFTPAPEECDCLVQGLTTWRPFPDTVPALKALKRRYRLAVISNVDDDLFAASARRLEVPFDWIVTAQQVGAYKPSEKNFRQALRRMGCPPERILHVAQSLYHDIRPAGALGWATVWVNRHGIHHPWGATLPAAAEPDLIVPDLASLISRIGI